MFESNNYCYWRKGEAIRLILQLFLLLPWWWRWWWWWREKQKKMKTVLFFRLSCCWTGFLGEDETTHSPSLFFLPLDLVHNNFPSGLFSRIQSSPICSSCSQSWQRNQEERKRKLLLNLTLLVFTPVFISLQIISAPEHTHSPPSFLL